jgi:ATP-binding cassette, subfamily C (CFTR/MRP), member 1
MDWLVTLGTSQSLQYSDLPPPLPADLADPNGASLMAQWAKQLSRTDPSASKALASACAFEFFLAGLCKLPADLLLFVGPYLLKHLVRFMDPSATGEDVSWRTGLTYVAALFVAQLLQSLASTQYFMRVLRVGARARAALCACVFDKALRLANEARQERTTGEIVNLMSVDAENVEGVFLHLHTLLWSAALQIGVAMYMMYQMLGAAAFAGLAAMVAVIPINSAIMRWMKKIQVGGGGGGGGAGARGADASRSAT